MIGLVKALSGLIKAFPKLAYILEDALFYFRNAQAESHRIDKDSSVDAFINKHSGMSCDKVQWSGEVDETSTSSGGGTGSTTFHRGSSEGDKQT